MKSWIVATAIAITQLGGAPTPEPPASSHCACDRGVCPIDANGRACSCGCGQRADRQAAQDLPALFDTRCVDGMAGLFPCRDVDLLAFLPHAEIGGGSGNDVWGWTDPETGREYAIVGRSTGTAFVEISNPRQPVYLGDLATHTAESIWRGIKVFADHAFIVSEAANHGMQIFDLKQLRRVASPPVAFVVVTVRPSGEGNFVMTAAASARMSNRALVQASAIATTRGIRYQPDLALRRPASGMLFRLGRNNTVQWTLRGVSGGLKIELSRDDGATWTTLSDDTPNLGFFDWAATGARSAAARIRLSSVVRPSLTQTSPSFAITP